MSLELADLVLTVPDGRSQRTLLDHASLAVVTGETVALTGASGSGKSTLLAVAGLLRHAESGRVVIGGTDASALDDRRRTRLRGRRIGIVYQSSNLLPALTAREQVEVVAHIGGSLDGKQRARARDLLERVGLADRLEARPAELSGGERQRVGIARALMGEPAVLLADEPTASLDAASGSAVLELLLHESHRVGAATLIVTHDPDEAARADRWVTLEHGEVTPARRS